MNVVNVVIRNGTSCCRLYGIHGIHDIHEQLAAQDDNCLIVQ